MLGWLIAFFLFGVMAGVCLTVAWAWSKTNT